MKVRLRKTWQGFPPGTVIGVANSRAALLEEMGIATCLEKPKAVRKPTPKKAEVKAEKVVSKTTKVRDKVKATDENKPGNSTSKKSS